MNDDLNIIWGPIRAIFEQSFTFGIIKQIVALAGIDITLLSDIRPVDGRGALLTFIDSLLKNMEQERKRQFVTICTEEILRRNEYVLTTLNNYLSRLGWIYYENNIIPVNIFDPSELPELPKEAHTDLIKAAIRLRDGDLSGAISAACGAVDSVTAKIYNEYGLGNPKDASFQEGVNRSFEAKKIIVNLRLLQNTS